MKWTKYIFYICTLVIIINNAILIKDVNIYSQKVEKIRSGQSIHQVDEDEQKPTKYLYKLVDSKYMSNISKISVSQDTVLLSMEIKNSKDIKNIAKDMEKTLEKEVRNTVIADDKTVMFMFK